MVAIWTQGRYKKGEPVRVLPETFKGAARNGKKSAGTS